MVPFISDLRTSVPAFGESVPVHGEGVLPRLNAAEGIYNGRPNGQDMARIREWTTEAGEADDWTVWCWLAFDTSINLDHEMFSPSVVRQYVDGSVGKNLILNHDWGDIRSSSGVIVEAKLFRLDSVPEDLRQRIPQFADTQAIAQAQGGYYWSMVKTAVRANTPGSQALAAGEIQHCSIGALPYDGQTYCPDCSMEEGRHVGFWETEVVQNEKGEDVEQYVCPHMPLSQWNLMLYSLFGDPDNPPNWSKGVGIDAALYPVELSACVQGAIGTAHLIRS